LGKMATTSVRRLISPLRRSSGLVTGMSLAGAPIDGLATLDVVSCRRDRGDPEHGRRAGR
jgi:hypothetical protein